MKTLITSNTKLNKSLGYSSLLNYQEQCSNSPPSLHALAESSCSFLHLIIADVSDDDEEIAAQALKCLGFMIYHPSIVATIPGENAKMVLESLAKHIIATKMKSICNLGVWCISVQQIEASVLAAHSNSLLQAVVHALDNPIGSLSTTFEAMQAVMKLVAQLRGKMRELSHIWVPPIYRRLLSDDKRERDMSERCLLKIRSTIIPPPPFLSKVIVQDLKKMLLSRMKDLLNKGMKVQSIQAWGWFIRILGSHAMKNRHLINDMLKLPEQTFSDRNPQVQLASQAAWEGLIDALIHPQILDIRLEAILENDVQQSKTSAKNIGEMQSNRFFKSTKLIMTPLKGIISSKCDVSVHLTCLNTWCYLLHKLDTSVNSPSVIELVLDPVFEAIFRSGPDCQSIWLWDFCLGLLDDLISLKFGDMSFDLNGQVSPYLSDRLSVSGASISSKSSWKCYPIKWLSQDLGHLGFYLKMISIIISHASKQTAMLQTKSLACNAALRIFGSVLKAAQTELKNESLSYETIMLCLKTILGFIKMTCEGACTEGGAGNDLILTSLKLIEVVTKESSPSILGSPLYKVALDLKYVGNMQIVDLRNENFLHQSSIAYMDMVSPMVYLIVLYISVVVQLTLISHELDHVLQGLQKLFKFVLSHYDPLEYLLVSIDLLYKHKGRNCMQIWMAMAKGLTDYIDGAKYLYQLKTEFNSSSYTAVCYLLSYPFLVWSSSLEILIPLEVGGSLNDSVSLSGKKLQHTVEVWKSLYGSICTTNSISSEINNFTADLCSMLSQCLDEKANLFECGSELDVSSMDLTLNFLFLSGEGIVCVLEQILSSDMNSDGIISGHECNCRTFSGINSVLEFAARYLKMSCIKIAAESATCLVISSRVFSALAGLLGCIHLKQDIVSFFEIISSPALQWLSHVEIPDQRVKHQLGILWSEILNCLQRSQPPIMFDTSFLKLQANLLEKALCHPNSSISDPTIAFWNTTYGMHTKLDYPSNLLHVLDKLSRNGRINLQKRSVPFLKRCYSTLADETVPQRYRVTATHNRSSKRVELMGTIVNQFEKGDKLPSSSKPKKRELTEHQKEVRRAQQGRDRDCARHGPGIWTYTSVDFSQGNEDSPESQDIRNPEAILEMFRKAA
ncbi:hypothetical protein SLEP1_g15039 [Rubroshorea leprosula]|uniref:Telomere-associated protein Rif1 N-terminal domain-containing protein n=2 Tax=Rubroshorea leprosula TaxID=152421 RepID=A0AAV5IV45_9ROSI|nr:hypothetical protein SLEP1_g15039 [Rubroshorea leprosula]